MTDSKQSAVSMSSHKISAVSPGFRAALQEGLVRTEEQTEHKFGKYDAQGGIKRRGAAKPEVEKTKHRCNKRADYTVSQERSKL